MPISRSATISASIWTSGRWIRRHPLRQQRFIQRHNIAFGDVTAPVQNTETIRHPADKGQVLLGEQHRQADIAIQPQQQIRQLCRQRGPLPREGSSRISSRGCTISALASASWY